MTPSPAELLALMPYAVTLGIELHTAAPAECTGSIPWARERCTAGGILHGGVLMSLADTVGAVCAFLNVPEGAATATADSSTRFLGAVRAGNVHARARPVKVGRSLIVVDTELTDDAGRLVARTSQAQMVMVS
jgi:1,4-dihydroxy-2-naphthoyl-CoA hydrolase